MATKMNCGILLRYFGCEMGERIGVQLWCLLLIPFS